MDYTNYSMKDLNDLQTYIETLKRNTNNEEMKKQYSETLSEIRAAKAAIRKSHSNDIPANYSCIRPGRWADS